LLDIVNITDKAYSKDEITQMEFKIISALDFKITTASRYSFLLRYLKAAHADRRMAWIACFITERVLHECEMLPFLPSVVASCSVYLARLNVNHRPWSPTLLKYTKYTESSLESCLKVMSSLLSSTTSLTAVNSKYRSQKFGAVSKMTLKGI
jgi:cyclin B